MDVNSDTLEVLACLQVKRILSQAQEHGLENPKAILCASKRISTAIEAYEHLNNLFASEEWTRWHATKTVGQYVTLWRDSSSIKRPRYKRRPWMLRRHTRVTFVPGHKFQR